MVLTKHLRYVRKISKDSYHFYTTMMLITALMMIMMMLLVELDYNVMSHAQKTIFVHGLNGRVHFL
jgi:hypothetical protein